MTETTAALRGWGPGWPNCQTSKMGEFTAAGRKFTCRKEAIIVFHYFVQRWHEEIENISAVADDGCFACRAIRGSSPPVASNHSWGLALDLNWQKHPLGKVGTFAAWQVLRIHQACRELRFMRWGGDYQNRKDEQHSEWMGTPADMAAMAKKIAALDPWPVFDGVVLKRGSKGRRVGMVQKRLGLTRTYIFDARTESAVRAFQTDRHEVVDGKVGKDSWRRLKWKLA